MSSFTRKLQRAVQRSGNGKFLGGSVHAKVPGKVLKKLQKQGTFNKPPVAKLANLKQPVPQEQNVPVQPEVANEDKPLGEVVKDFYPKTDPAKELPIVNALNEQLTSSPRLKPGDSLRGNLKVEVLE